MKTTASMTPGLEIVTALRRRGLIGTGFTYRQVQLLKELATPRELEVFFRALELDVPLTRSADEIVDALFPRAAPGAGWLPLPLLVC